MKYWYKNKFKFNHIYLKCLLLKLWCGKDKIIIKDGCKNGIITYPRYTLVTKVEESEYGYTYHSKSLTRLTVNRKGEKRWVKGVNFGIINQEGNLVREEFKPSVLDMKKAYGLIYKFYQRKGYDKRETS